VIVLYLIFSCFLSVMLVLLSGAPAGFFSVRIGGGRGQWLGGTMARAEHEPITGVWRQSPQRGQGAEPLVRGGRSPLKLKAFLVVGCATEPANLAPASVFLL